jgi:hypothetical protein
VGELNRATELRREDIVTGLEKMNVYLAGQGVRGEICIYGGACMCLAFKARISTKDIDAVFEPAAIVRKAAFEVAHEMGWAWTWMNDDVKGFLSPASREERTFLPLPELSHLRIYVPTPEYLLAMKCLAARPGDEENPSHDFEDALWLARHLGIKDKAALLNVLHRHFPERPLPDRTGFFLRELVASLDPPAS